MKMNVHNAEYSLCRDRVHCPETLLLAALGKSMESFICSSVNPSFSLNFVLDIKYK